VAVAWARLSQKPGRHIVETAIESRAVGGKLRFAVWLPPGYATHTRRHYPVLYVLHGLPGGATTYRSLLFLVPILDRLRAQALVVFPQAARVGDSDDEYLDLGPGRNWATALTRELPAAVAARFRTLPTRAARGIIGISAGGYGAAILGLHNLDRYRVIESWSGYFHATTPDGSAPMSLAPGVAKWSDAHALVPRLATTLRRNPTLLAFYTGSEDPYPGFTTENRRFDGELSAAGIPHRFAVYPGGHNTALWLAHASGWFLLALQALAPAH
jgi:enterochelin esterase-like enzyme